MYVTRKLQSCQLLFEDCTSAHLPSAFLIFIIGTGAGKMFIGVPTGKGEKRIFCSKTFLRQAVFEQIFCSCWVLINSRKIKHEVIRKRSLILRVSVT